MVEKSRNVQPIYLSRDFNLSSSDLIVIGQRNSDHNGRLESSSFIKYEENSGNKNLFLLTFCMFPSASGIFKLSAILSK